MKKLWLIFFFLSVAFARAQKSKSGAIISGPMLGQVEIRTASIWLQVSSDITSARLIYWKQGHPERSWQKIYDGSLGKEFNPIRFDIGGLDINSFYQYQFVLNQEKYSSGGTFRTKDLWQWRKPAPDFSFITGSCAYFNEPVYDRPGKPYGGDSIIFESMANDSAAFTLWLGDNWYTREVDLLSPWGLWYRASRDRAQPVLKNLLKNMPQYAIWDDHDFGPDNSGTSYGLKEVSREIFMKYWCNPFYGEDQKGIYSQLSYSDMDLFLTDDRYFRSADELADSLNGKPNPDKHFFGQKQLHWLEDALVQSLASFKIIVVGSQTLNPMSRDEGFYNYSYEYHELMDFLYENHIKGVLFLTGDRHHSEIVKTERPGNYDLYDITVSPFTSGVAKVKGAEIDNPARVPGSLVEKRNYARISVRGEKNERTCVVQFVGEDGKTLYNWSISEKQLGR
ncbi:MAG TPA: alkaline phosphatase D family protein [Puia sp.]